jgi:hypothetical protein
LSARHRAAFAVLFVAALTAPGGAQQVTVVDMGPGASGRIVQRAAARAHTLIEPDSIPFVQRRGQQEASTLLVLGRNAVIEGNVDGDVIVVSGDLFVHPAAHIGGRAVAIGGGVYPSALAVIGGGTESFRDNTFTITRTAAGYELRYLSLREAPSPPLLFPGIYGLRMPSYDRVNGASVPFGPTFTFADGRGMLDGTVTYRSDLGKVDPLVRGSLEITRRTRVEGSVGRSTLTNDAWIWSDLVNSLSVLAFGEDTRNYYRADRAEVSAHRAWEWTNTQVEPFIGARFERGWTVGPAVGEASHPRSAWGNDDSLDIRRPNPAIMDGHITSALVGARLDWSSGGVDVGASSVTEVAISAPGDRRFTQVTTDAQASFLTFGEQEYGLDVHWVTTPSDVPPPQRFAYLGGAGTLSFDDLLSLGGDELLLIDQRYSYPLLNVRLGLLGSPTLLLRHRLASAGVTKLPAFHQILGLGVMVVFSRLEWQIDPGTGDTRVSFGLSFSR